MPQLPFFQHPSSSAHATTTERASRSTLCSIRAVISDPASPEAQKLEAAVTALLQVGLCSNLCVC